ncbi:MAG: Holliday junction resolvase RuvX [bacterium]|nr:Holliday junction resolvase RuvX [bacterium]
MRYLGIDYGTKKIGLALSDEEGRLAFPHLVIPSGNSIDISIELKKMIEDENVNAVVIGESLDFKGEENIVAKKARALARALEDTGLPVHFEPEFLSSVQAKRSTEDAKADAAAAAIVLQTFLDKRANLKT